MKILNPLPILLSFTYFFVFPPSYAQETRDGIPSDMTCQEYIDLQPEYRPSIAFWLANRDNNFTGPNYVSMQTAITVWEPELLKKCKKNKNQKLGDIIEHK